MTAREPSVMWRVSTVDAGDEQQQHLMQHPHLRYSHRQHSQQPDPTQFAMAVLGNPDSPVIPSKRLLDFMPLDMSQVRHRNSLLQCASISTIEPKQWVNRNGS